MTDRHATTADLPGWNKADTVLGLAQRPGLSGWVWLWRPSDPTTKVQPLGRDLAGRLYVDSSSAFAESVHQNAVEQGYLALLIGVEDGVALWLPEQAYHHIKPVDPEAVGEQPDVPRWLPVREVLKEAPADEWRKLGS